MFSDDRVTAPWFTLEVMDSVCVGVCVCVCICLALQETQKPLYQPCSGVLLQQAGLGFAQRSSHTDSHTVAQDIPGGLPPCGHQNSLHCGASHRLLGPPEVSSGDRGPLVDSLLFFGKRPSTSIVLYMGLPHATLKDFPTLKAVETTALVRAKARRTGV